MVCQNPTNRCVCHPMRSPPKTIHNHWLKSSLLKTYSLLGSSKRSFTTMPSWSNKNLRSTKHPPILMNMMKSMLTLNGLTHVMKSEIPTTSFHIHTSTNMKAGCSSLMEFATSRKEHFAGSRGLSSTLHLRNSYRFLLGLHPTNLCTNPQQKENYKILTNPHKSLHKLAYFKSPTKKCLKQIPTLQILTQTLPNPRKVLQIPTLTGRWTQNQTSTFQNPTRKTTSNPLDKEKQTTNIYMNKTKQPKIILNKQNTPNLQTSLKKKTKSHRSKPRMIRSALSPETPTTSPGS